MSMVHLSAGINAPASPELLSEPAIVARLAESTLGARSTVPWRWLVDDYDRIRDLVARIFDGFHDFNARVRVPGGFQLPNGARERTWHTPDGRASFRTHPIPVDTALHRARADSDAPVFNLTTVRSHDQYNTTIYGLDDRYRGVHGERRVLFAHADDIAALGLSAGERVDLEGVADDGVQRMARRFLLAAYDIPRGCLAAYYPETNALVPLDSYAVGARTPTSKSIPVRIHRHAPDASASARDIPLDVVA